MRHVALNVYFWGEREQDRLLTECLGPTSEEMWHAGALTRFWVDRFDTRGPHVMVLLDAPHGRAEEVRRLLEARVDAYLARAPSPVRLSEDELGTRHRQCRGKHLCSLDLLPGMEPNNVQRWADDPEDAYVMRRTPGMDGPALHALLGDLALWSIARLRAGGTTATAIRWVAGFSTALRAAGENPAELWRFYAASLVLRLREAIAAEDPAVAAGLPRLIGPQNLAVMDRLWDAAEAEPPVWPGMHRLATVFAASRGDDPGLRLHFARELTHAVLAQLGQFVRFRIPLSLYAWHRTRVGEPVPA